MRETPSGSPQSLTPAEAEYFAFLERVDAGEAEAFETLLARHAALAAELRALHREHEAATELCSDLRAGRATDPPPDRSDAQREETSSRQRFDSLSDKGCAQGRYRIEREVARGGMGAVLEVWDAELRRTLAMKVALWNSSLAFDGRPTPTDDRTLGRFLEEAQVTGQLDHPGIVPVHELGVDEEGRAYFTMRLVQGRSFREICGLVHAGQEGWSHIRALGVMLKVCEAMAYAHTKRVVHRDLKPSNVMVGRFGEVYVMDWGVAKVAGRADKRDLRLRLSGETTRLDTLRAAGQSSDEPLLTMDGSIVGTPAYMSPEQARGQLELIDHRSDIYSVGAMIYHQLTGQMPYVAPDTHAPSYLVVLWVREGPPRPVRELWPDVPHELEAICEKAMAREPRDRYATMSDLAEDLRAFLESRVVSAYETGPLAEARKWVVRNTALAGALAAALVLLVVGLAFSSTMYFRAEERAAAVFKLSSIQDLRDLEDEADRLWPPTTARTDEYLDWLRRAEEQVAALIDHQAALDEIRGRRLETAEDSAETPTFRSSDDQWWHAQLTQLVTDLRAFADAEHGLIDGLSKEHGLGVRRRLELAREIEELSLGSERARQRWAEATASIADRTQCPRYGGLELAPQMGLLPLGRDPASGLWEFAHVYSGELPERDPTTGALLTNERTCVVLVLLPGAAFSLGSQNIDPNGERYDPERDAGDPPLEALSLEPFFVSKYELTQGNWLHCTGFNPSRLSVEHDAPEAPTLRRPVESVTWLDNERVLLWMGLSFPTEAQWEYAARAGTDTPWWSGGDKASIEGCANLADRYSKEHYGLDGWVYDESMSDGFSYTAPVGSFRPNAFGLYDTMGNVWEWCLEKSGGYDAKALPGTGQRPRTAKSDVTSRRLRGGSFKSTANHLRSSRANAGDELSPRYEDGVRPVRAIDPRQS